MSKGLESNVSRRAKRHADNEKLTRSFTQRRSHNEDLSCVLFSENPVMGKHLTEETSLVVSNPEQ